LDGAQRRAHPVGRRRAADLSRVQPDDPDHNVATLYGYDGLGRSALITETGILTETFNPTTRTEYDALSRPMTVTLNYCPGLPANADTNIQLIVTSWLNELIQSGIPANVPEAQRQLLQESGLLEALKGGSVAVEVPA